jgi:plastocyanin
MRKTLMAGLVLVLAACGGGEQGGAEGGAATADTTAAAPAPAGGETAGAATAQHEVQMTMENGQPRFVPAELTVKPGETIKFVNGEGGPHNVAFWTDSIPSGAESAITIDQTMGPLTSQMLVEQGAAINVTIGSSAPNGEYKYYCQPHLAQGMTAKITVQQ